MENETGCLVDAHTTFVKGFGAESIIKWNLFFFSACLLLTFRLHSKGSCLTGKLQAFTDPEFDSAVSYLSFLSHLIKGKVLYKVDLLLKRKKKVHLPWSEVFCGLIKNQCLQPRVSTSSPAVKSCVSQFLWTKTLFLSADVQRLPNWITNTFEKKLQAFNWHSQRILVPSVSAKVLSYPKLLF